MRCTNCGVTFSEDAVACSACGLTRAHWPAVDVIPYPVVAEPRALPTTTLTLSLWARSLPRAAPLAGAAAALSLSTTELLLPRAGAMDVMAVFMIVGVVLQAITMTAMTAVADATLRGTPPSPLVAIGRGFVPALWLLAGLIGLSALAVFVGGGFIQWAATALPGAMTAIIAMQIAFMLVAFFVAVRLAPTLAILVVERVAIHDALARAWVLTRKWRSSVTGAALLSWLAYTSVTMIAMLLVMPLIGDRLVFHAAVVLLAGLTGPFVPALSVATYAASLTAEKR